MQGGMAPERMSWINRPWLVIQPEDVVMRSRPVFQVSRQRSGRCPLVICHDTPCSYDVESIQQSVAGFGASGGREAVRRGMRGDSRSD